MAFDSDGQCIGPTALIAAPQTVTAAWVDLGSEFILWKMKSLLLWLQITHNGSSDIRARLLIKHEYGGTLEYPLQIETVSATAVKLNNEYKEIDTDVTQNKPISWGLDGCVPVGQFQVMAGTLGAPADIIETAYYTASM